MQKQPSTSGEQISLTFTYSVCGVLRGREKFISEEDPQLENVEYFQSTLRASKQLSKLCWINLDMSDDFRGSQRTQTTWKSNVGSRSIAVWACLYKNVMGGSHQVCIRSAPPPCPDPLSEESVINCTVKTDLDGILPAGVSASRHVASVYPCTKTSRA